jgi:hypothetical protein
MDMEEFAALRMYVEEYNRIQREKFEKEKH